MRRPVFVMTGAVLLMAATGAWAWGQEGGPEERRAAVLVTEIRGLITPVMEDHIREAVGRAERDRFAALVVQIDTPGGLDASMRGIVQSFLTSRVPVIA